MTSLSTNRKPTLEDKSPEVTEPPTIDS